VSARSRCLALLGGAIMVVAAASTAAAQDDERGFWRSVREPGHARAMHLARQGSYLLGEWGSRRKENVGGPFELHAILEGAIERLALAHRLAPTDPMMVYLHAEAVSMWEQPGQHAGARMDDEALELFLELRALDPNFNPSNVAANIADIHTRAHRFAEAAAEYRRAIGFAIAPDPLPWSNLGEVTMLAGDLEAAVRYYERAMAIAEEIRRGAALPLSELAAALPLFGLSVALDRLGEHQRALEVAEDATDATSEGMAILRSNGVYFEPAYEIHYYEGLAHRAQAQSESDPRTRQSAWAASQESFRRFLAEGGTASRWASLAERHAEAEAPRPGRRRR
jgi:tetratricopeptide (TPR) repeat protein